MKKIILLLTICIIGSVLAGCQPGEEAAMNDVVDFYYTYDRVGFNAEYQRYRFYLEDERYWFYHETRKTENDYGWNSEDDITRSGTIELSESEWAAFLGYLEKGMAKDPEESLEDGNSGPWMFIYFPGDPELIRKEFDFDSVDDRSSFEDYCAELARRGRETESSK